MDLRYKFDEDVDNYDKWRPKYTTALFNEIICRSSLGRGKEALEIGIGTGQATLPILLSGCKVTAIDIGERLVEYSRRKFERWSSFNVINIGFEDYEKKCNTYDLIYSATAFHWIKEDIGFNKIYRLLKPGGSVALFWNHPFVNREDEPLHSEIQRQYFRIHHHKISPVEFNESKCNRYKKLLNDYGFINISSTIYRDIRRLNADEYVSLLNTYSDHRAIGKRKKKILESEIARLINKHGGELSIYDTMDLYIANKPLVN